MCDFLEIAFIIINYCAHMLILSTYISEIITLKNNLHIMHNRSINLVSLPDITNKKIKKINKKLSPSQLFAQIHLLCTDKRRRNYCLKYIKYIKIIIIHHKLTNN